MKLFMCMVLLLAINGFNCAPYNDDDDDFGERKYGLGLDLGGNYKGGVELGLNNRDGTHSVFLNKEAKGGLHTGVGFFKSFKPYVPSTLPYNPYDPRYIIQSNMYPQYPYQLYPQNPDQYPQYPGQYSQDPGQYPHSPQPYYGMPPNNPAQKKCLACK